MARAVIVKPTPIAQGPAPMALSMAISGVFSSTTITREEETFTAATATIRAMMNSSSARVVWKDL